MVSENQADDHEEEEEYEEGRSGGFLLLTATPSWLVSAVVHGVMLVVLALYMLPEAVDKFKTALTVGPNEEVEEIEEFEEITEEIEMETDTEVVTDAPVQFETTEEVVDVTENISPAMDIDAAAVAIELSEFGETTAPKNDLMSAIGAVTGKGFEGRGAAARSKMAKKNGGSAGSEAAVQMALAWLAQHQMPDGGWNFDHRPGQCGGRCNHHGSKVEARNGATAMALLPFLGAGQTHKEGNYKEVVGRGLYFLAGRMKGDGSLFEPGGTMYSHGLAGIVLCEAYAMTHDRNLMLPAQGSLNFISKSQDPVGGGWRYQPNQPGDTSAVGWQIMALKSGHMAYLQVNPMTVKGAVKFLDSVQMGDYGSYYGYTTPAKRSSTTAIGLLCRMYLGWKKDHPALADGVAYLGGTGPSKGNMYYNYYATQVMRQYGGDPWEKWNLEMRDYLVNSQSKNGHQKGSWFFEGGGHGAEAGGRVYATSLATMILEVYYRHMPIYGEAAVQEDFPL